VDNEIRPEPRARLEPNDYALRRRVMIDMLSRCDVVHAVSSFVASKFAAMGVPRERLRTISIGTRMVELARPMAALAPPTPSGPLRLLFIGYHNRYKGLQVLVDAMELLPAEVARGVALAVHAKDLGSMVDRLDALRGRLAGVHVEGAYEASRVPALCRGQHVGVVPSVWWDNGPQTVLEFLACGLPVLGANVGGIPDQVRDGENGLLFRANDRADLARAITRLAREDGLVERLRGGVRPPKSMPEHAREIAGVYEHIANAR
jgi:glycosyltransferase involved in cell wall biosynthesis